MWDSGLRRSFRSQKKDLCGTLHLRTIFSAEAAVRVSKFNNANLFIVIVFRCTVVGSVFFVYIFDFHNVLLMVYSLILFSEIQKFLHEKKPGFENCFIFSLPFFLPGCIKLGWISSLGWRISSGEWKVNRYGRKGI